MSESIILKEDEISCSPDPAQRGDSAVYSKVTNPIHQL